MISYKLSDMLKFKTFIEKIVNLSRKYYFRIPLVVILFLVTLGVGYNTYFSDKIFPGVKVLGIDVSGKTVNQAFSLLSEKVIVPEKISFEGGGKPFELSLTELALFYDIEKTANLAYRTHRTGSWQENILGRITSPLRSYVLELAFVLDEQKLNEYLEVVSEQVATSPIYPEVKFETDEIVVTKGSPGEILDIQSLITTLNKKLASANFSTTLLPFKKIDPSISDNQALGIKKRAEKLLGKTLVLTNDFDTYSFDQNTLFSLLDPFSGFNQEQVENFIEKELTPKVERPPQNAVFRFENGKVLEFIPAKDGLAIERSILDEEIIKTLTSLENSEGNSASLQIPVVRALPEITLDDVNDLGISKLLGLGTSKFRGSIPGRIHNISLASSKFNGVLVAPGETLSFNKILGDVSVFTGYKQAYIIRDGRTVLGDGGGVCQVSTTLFRAALNAGLPITERRAHSYRVSYYEQDGGPGLDATVFDPTTDFKFINNTPGHLLIQTKFDSATSSLAFEIYGTSDGRVASITKPVIRSSVAPPEDLYVDDPGLPAGTVKQIDYKAYGAKVDFNYTVEKNGEKIINTTFVSNYRPWQAIFLRGTGPAN